MAVNRRVKIVCTLGPAVASPERIRGLVEAGMDVARMNFSHGAHADHERVYQLVREAAKADRPGGRRSWPTCRARRSGWAGSPTARTSGAPATRS